MARLYPLSACVASQPASNSAALFTYEASSSDGVRLGRALLALIHLEASPNILPAQRDTECHPDVNCSPESPIPMLYAEPGPAISDILFGQQSALIAETIDSSGTKHCVSALRDPTLINIVCTELAQRRLIIAEDYARWQEALSRSRRSPSPPHPEQKISTAAVHPHGFLHLRPDRPEDAVFAALYNEECSSDFRLRPIHRVLRRGRVDAMRLLDRALLYFHIDHIPAAPGLPITGSRVEYLLSHGTDLGGAFVVLIGSEAYLFRARLDVVAALISPTPQSSTAVEDAHGVLTSAIAAPADILILQLLLERTLGLTLDHDGISLATDLKSAIASAYKGDAIAFCMNAPTLTQVQRAALKAQPLPADTFTISPRLPLGIITHAGAA